MSTRLGASAPLVLAPGQEASYKRWLTKEWFKQPAWSNGPPRWQVATAGSVLGAGLIAVIVGLAKK